MKKKIVGGSSAKNSSLSLVDSLDIELNCDESYRFHGSWPRIWLGRMRRTFHDRRDQVIDKKAGDPCEPPAVKVTSVTGWYLCWLPLTLASFSPFPLSLRQG